MLMSIGSPQAQLVLVIWPLIVCFLFIRYSQQRAVIISFLIAWLFLPHRTSFIFQGLPDYERISATCYSIFIATLIFDSKRFQSFKFGWLDIPMLVWCLCPFPSSLVNGLGAYDGIAQTLNQVVAWGFPYYLGRIYLNNLAGLRQMAIAMFTGGLIYIPLCLLEVRISPQLHNMAYGYHPRADFAQNIRYGGYRPTVFMEHGLEVGVWMLAASMIGVWLWQSGVLKRVWNIPMTVILPVLVATFVLVKSTGAWGLFAIGIMILFSAKWLRSGILLWLLLGGIVIYLILGVSGTFDGDGVVSFISETINPERAQSLGFRFNNEEILGEKAREQFLLGWGGWGRNRVFEYNRMGELEDITVTDSLWIIVFGNRGIIGLFGLIGTFLFPVILYCGVRYKPQTWFHPKIAPGAVLSVVLALYLFDCLLNAMMNPIYTFACGGLTGLLLNPPESLTNRRKLPAKQSSRGQPPRRTKPIPQPSNFSGNSR
jgi:hypothetical protein